MNTIYKLGSEFNGTTGGIEDVLRTFKGETEISFDLTDLATGQFSIAKIIINFNDGSPLLIREYTFGEDKKIVSELIKKTYYPDTNTYFVVYYPTIYITYSNFNQFLYQTPIRIAKESFFSEYENLTIGATQFVDNTDNSMFVVFDSAKGSNYNLRIK
jgi:hypothetical protein